MALTRRELKKHRAEVVQTTHDFSEATLRVDIASIGRYWRFAVACTITVPDDRTIPVDSEIRGRQGSAGEITFIPIDGVIINGVDGYNNATNLEGSVFKLKKVATMEWDLEAVPSLALSGGADVTPPTITSAATTSVYENNTLSFALTADEPVVWSIVGSADQAQFEISGATLRWLSDSTRDFEAPADADTDNDYLVTVRATDLAGNMTDQIITVTVLNVVEPGIGLLTLDATGYAAPGLDFGILPGAGATALLTLTGVPPVITVPVVPGVGLLTLDSTGYGPPSVVEIIDPAFLSWAIGLGYNPTGSITLGRTLTKTSGLQGVLARPRTPETSPAKFYFEAQATENATYQIGIAEKTATLNVNTTVIGTSPETAGVTVTGPSLRVEGSVEATLSATPGANRIRVAVDPVNRLLWMAVAAGTWNGSGLANPATGTGGVSLTGLSSDDIMPALGAGVTTGSVTAYLQATAWTYAAPTGFAQFPAGRPGWVGVSPNIVGGDNTTSIAVTYPTLVEAGDFLLLVLSSDVVASTFTTPSGWTAFASELVNGSSLVTKLFWKLATGSETGTLTCTQSSAGVAGNLFAGSMTRFNNVVETGTPYEDFDSVTRVAASTFTGLTVTPTDVNRLAVTVIAFGNDGVIMNDATGWQTVSALTNQTSLGNDGSHFFFIQDGTNGGTVSAQTETAMGVSVEANVYVFALIPRV